MVQGASIALPALRRAGPKSLGWLETAYELHEPRIFAIPYANPELKKRDWEAARAEIAERFHMGE